MVTNPATRDWTVTASTYATLNEMYGNRTVCGIGRGDSAVRVTNGKPTTLATMAESIHVIRELANGRSVEYKGSTITLPWASKSRLEVWGAGYGPKALKLIGETCDGFILQLADLADRRVDDHAPCATRPPAAGRDPDAITICVAAPAYVGDDLGATMRDQCRWFGGMVGNHVADIVERYGDERRRCPQALTDYIKGREGYDYNEHGQAGNIHTAFVPDEIVDRFCILGPVDEHVRRLDELRDLGVDQFAIYLQHDGKDSTLQAYGEHVIPAVAEYAVASVSRERPHARASFVAALSCCVGRRSWELYKELGPDDGGAVLGWTILPARQRHRDAARVGHARRATPSPSSRAFGPRRSGGSCSPARGTRSASPLLGFALGVAVGLALAVVMARFRVVERGAAAVPRRRRRRCR